MKVRHTAAYIGSALLIAGIGIIISIAMGLILPSASVKNLGNEGEEIVRRAAATAEIDNADNVINSIQHGEMSLSDYVTIVLTDSQYMLLNKTDAGFASDLCVIAYGQEDSSEVSSIVEKLKSQTRAAVISDVLSEIDSDYEATCDIPDGTGSVLENCEITKPLESTDGYVMGIKQVEGTFSIEGNEVRTDFFVDGDLYQGYLTMSQGDGSDEQSFVLNWDTSGVDKGSHSVKILLRTSDGRGTVLTGGDISIPECMTLLNDHVELGSIEQGVMNSWYTFNAEDRDAYVNFVGLSDDIKVRLYNIFGEQIGENDLTNSDYEVLRGEKQDVSQISSETGITGISNVYYVRVERGAECSTMTGRVTYTMVQSENVAYYNGEYMAVKGDDLGLVPENTNTGASTSVDVELIDLNQNEIDEDSSNVTFLPINSVLNDLWVTDSSTGRVISLCPEFDKKTVNYGYYTSATASLSLNFETQEGYAATADITVENKNSTYEVNPGDVINLVKGNNIIDIKVKGFSGNERDYKLYVLYGSEDSDFYNDQLSQFPESYYSGLWLLHNIHPDYNFRAYNTGLSFSTVLNNEDSGSRNLANINSNPSWVVSSSPVYDGGGWMQAKTSVVSYFLDPRNFLDEVHIFEFELLSFDPDCQTLDGISSMISGSFMDTSDTDFASILYEAGEEANVSPYLLASRIIQEMGYSGVSPLCTGTLPGYEGYYNFFDIGATPDPDIENGAQINGARYAMWGSNPDEEEITSDEEELRLPWDNIEDAIIGGAIWIASGYTAIGQDTLYTQKFDIVNNTDGLYEHQYAQNVSMAYSESERYYNSYADIGMLDQGFTFVIPVYNDMPEDYGTLPET